MNIQTYCVSTRNVSPPEPVPETFIKNNMVSYALF